MNTKMRSAKQVFVFLAIITFIQFILVNSILAQNIEKKTERYIETLVELGKFSGSVFVAKDDKVLYNKAFGLADFENNISNTPTTRFNLGDMTMPFTALAIMHLFEANRIDLNKSITSYIPEFPDQWSGITIHHLLNHVSGLTEYTRMDEFKDLTENASSLLAFVDVLKTNPLRS